MTLELDLLLRRRFFGIPNPDRFVIRARGYLGSGDVPGDGAVAVIVCQPLADNADMSGIHR